MMMKKSDKRNGSVKGVLNGSFLTKKTFSELFAFMFYVAVLLMVLITNTYLAEERTREIAKNAKELNDLQVEYIQLKSAIMQNSKQSVLATRLAPYGIKEPTEPLKRIPME